KRYDELLEQSGLVGFLRRPAAHLQGRHTYNQYVVRVPAIHRDSMVKHLRDSGVSCDVYYPLSLHQQDCFQFLGHQEGDFPSSEEAARTVMALPIFPEITADQQARVVEACASYLHQSIRLAA